MVYISQLGYFVVQSGPQQEIIAAVSIIILVKRALARGLDDLGLFCNTFGRVTNQSRQTLKNCQERVISGGLAYGRCSSTVDSPWVSC